MDRMNRQTQGQPGQEQERQPGFEDKMEPLPLQADEDYQSGNKLTGKIALINRRGQRHRAFSSDWLCQRRR